MFPHAFRVRDSEPGRSLTVLQGEGVAPGLTTPCPRRSLALVPTYGELRLAIPATPQLKFASPLLLL